MSKKSYNIIKNCIVCPECKFGCISNNKIQINYRLFELCKCGKISLTTSTMYNKYNYNLFTNANLINFDKNCLPALDIFLSEDKDKQLYFISLSKIKNNLSIIGDNHLMFNELLEVKYKDNLFYIRSKDINDFIKQFQIVVDDIFKIKENLLFI